MILSAPPRPLIGASLLAAAIALLGTPAPALAHSFLVSTSPAQGQRLSQAPDSLLLEFSEKVDIASTELRLLSPEGTLVGDLKPELSANGLGIRAAVEVPEEEIYVVSWQAQSAVDGHGSSGEYAFSTGPVSATGVLPGATQSEPVDKASLISSWLFGFGLAGALGGLVLRAIGVIHTLNSRAAIRTGLFFGLAGVATAAWSNGSRSAMLAVTAQLLFLPLVLVGAGRSWKLASGSTMLAAGAWASRSHGAAEGPLGWAVDYLHLVVGAAWAGSLGLVLVIGWQARRSRADWLPALRLYARPALWFVLVLGATGTVAALSLVPSWEQLWSTSYGRTLVLKITVFCAALVAALAARRWGLRGSHAALARRAMSAEGLFVVSAIVLAGVLASGAPPPDAATAEQLLGPVPLSSQVTRDAGLAGQLNVEVSSDGERLDVRIFGPSGTVPGTDIQAVLTDPAGSVDLKPRPCGSGCFTQAVDLKPGSSRVTVAARAPEWAGGQFPATLHWPPGEHSPNRLQDLVTKMRSIPELTVIETVDSGPGSVVEPHTITVTGDQFIDAEPYAGANLNEVWVLARSPERLRLYLPGSQISAFLELDSEGRIARARLITPGHEITRQFSYNER